MSSCESTFSFEDWALGKGVPKGFEGTQSFKRVGWVYASINAIATTASGAPIGFYNGSILKSKRITDKSHPVIKLFEPPKAPNVPSFRELIYRTFINLGISGVVYWVFTRKNGVVEEVETKSRSSIIPVFNHNKNVLMGWVEKSTGTVYPVNDVLPIRYYDPDDEFGGLPPLSAARMSVESEVSIAAWNTSFFKTGMKNPMIIKSKGQLTKEQKSELKKEIVNYYSGIEGGQSALLLQGNVEAESLILRSKDIDFINGKKLNREEITAIFQVPPSIVGIYEYSSYANVREQRKIFWEHTLLPKMNVIIDLLQINILDKEFPGIKAQWETSEIPALQTDPVEAAQAIRTYYDMGLTLESISALINLPSLGDAKIRKDFNQVPESSETLPVETAEPKKPKKELTDFYKIHEKLSIFSESVSKIKNPNLSLWSNLWIELLEKDLKEIAKTTFFELNKNDLKIDLTKEISEYIQYTLEFPKFFITSSENQLVLEENKLKISNILVNGIIETVKYHFFKKSGVKKIIWVCQDEKHKHLNGKEVQLGRSFSENSTLKHPYDSNALAIDVLDCSCTIEPV